MSKVNNTLTTMKERKQQITKESEIYSGETRIMSCGELAFIAEYRSNKDITIQFKSTGELINTTYESFKNGEVKSHFTPTVYGIGIVGLETTKDNNGKMLKAYSEWVTMLRRCYSVKFQEKQPTYKECVVCEDWITYRNFKIWFDENYYELNEKTMNLDKDILHKGNKIYSPENCVFVPQDINKLFVKRDASRGNLPIGVCFDKKINKYRVQCRIFNIETEKSKQKNLGRFYNKFDAFILYKKAKEDNIKIVANYYKKDIPNKLYNAMINYKVEITD